MKANWTPWVIFPALFLLGIEAVQGQQAMPGRGYGSRPMGRAVPTATQADLQYAPGMGPPAYLPAAYADPDYGAPEPDGGPAYQAAPIHPTDGSEDYAEYVEPRRLPHTYGTVEYMMAWTSGSSTPPLVTTSPFGTSRFDPPLFGAPNAGVIGAAGQVIFGGVETNKDMRNGGRIDAGIWLDECGTAAIGGRFMALAPDKETFDEASIGGVRTLAIPFIDPLLPGENAFLVGYLDPDTGDLFEGFVNAVVEQSVLTADLYTKIMMHDDENLRVDVLGGYFYGRVDDRLNLTFVSQQTQAGGFPFAGPVFDIRDQFRSTNEINAGEIGISVERRWNRWTATTQLRSALGINTQNVRVTAAGSNINGVPVTNGFFASNQILGSFTRHQFIAVPEIDFTVGYWITPHVRLTAGYTGMLFTNIVQSGDILDRNVGPIGAPNPQFNWRDGEFWVQGINVGVNWDF